MTDCLQCGKEIEIVDANSKYKKFCNRTCSGTYNSSRRKVNPEWFDSIRKEKPCKICGSVLSLEIRKNSHTKFCSDQCKEKSLKSQRKREKAIKAEFPFENMEYYTLVSKKNGRTSVSLSHINGSHSKHISYARYLMSVHLGRILEESEHVDHINNDPLDDRIENLQILSHSENCSKFNKEIQGGKTLIDLICPCGVSFTRKKGNTHLTPSRKAINTFCSRKCPENHKNLKEAKTVVLREYKEFE